MQATTWTSKTGKTITATPVAKMPAWLKVAVDGEEIGNGCLFGAADKQVANLSAALAQGGLTHVIVCGKVPVGVPSDVAARIVAAQEAAASLPPSLGSERETLVAAVQGAGDEWSAARERAFGDDAGRGWDKVAHAERAVKAAEKALADFDDAHPEIVAAIKAEQAEATERFLRAD